MAHDLHDRFRSKLYGMPNRVLIVDDETDITAILCDRLQAIGFDVLTAANGLEAINILKRTPIDAMLLDLVMPQMDGLTTLRRLRDEHMLVPVIMVSASANEAMLEQATREGAKAYIFKPIDFAELELKLRDLLSSPR